MSDTISPSKKEKRSKSSSEKKKDSSTQISKSLSKTSLQDQTLSSSSSTSPQKQSSSTSTTTSSKESSKSKSSSSSSSSLPSLPKDPIKILSKSLKFQNYESVLKLLSKNNTNFTVVGVIGGQSSGKSTLLSSLIKRSLNNQYQSQLLQQLQQQQQQSQSQIQSQQPQQHIAANTPINPTILQSQSKVNKNSDFINNLTLFESLTDSNFGLGKHQTIGIDLFISEEERIIYLDTQPLQSLSIVCEMIEENYQLPNNYNSYEHFHHMECLKLVVFLLSVCNIVLIVQENKSLDIPLCKLIRTASLLLKNKTPDVSNPTPNGTLHNFENDILESTARQIFIFNKLTEIDTNDTSFDKTLSVLFSNPKNLYQSFISNLSSFNNSNNNNNNNNSHHNSSVSDNNRNEQTNKILLESKCQSMTHFDSFFIPDKYMQEILHNATTEILGVNSSDMLNPNSSSTSKKRPQQTNTKLQPTFNESIEFLHKHLLLLRSNSKFTHDITERQWFENTSNLWNYIQECDLMDSYNNQLLNSKYLPLNQFNQQSQQQQQQQQLRDNNINNNSINNNNNDNINTHHSRHPPHHHNNHTDNQQSKKQYQQK